LEDIDRFLVEITAQSSAASELPPWEQIGMFVSRLGADLGVALPKIRSAVKSGQTVSSGCNEKATGSSTVIC
jgi:dynactin 1